MSIHGNGIKGKAYIIKLNNHWQYTVSIQKDYLTILNIFIIYRWVIILKIMLNGIFCYYLCIGQSLWFWLHFTFRVNNQEEKLIT